jgi:hypothetical protein
VTVPPPPPPAAGTPVATLWERLLSVALVGTERKPPPTDALAQVMALIGPPDDTSVAGLSSARTAPATPYPVSDAGNEARTLTNDDDAADRGTMGRQVHAGDGAGSTDAAAGEAGRPARTPAPETGEAGVDAADTDGPADTSGPTSAKRVADTSGTNGGAGAGDTGGSGGHGQGVGGVGGTNGGRGGRGRGAAELGVVTAAGVVATYRRVGLVVEHSDAGLPEAAAVDERAEASATGAQLLGLLLEGHVRVLGGPTELVEDWLLRCSAGGRRPPARLLPGLLDHATRILALRPAVATAGGPRAAWLAGQNPHWAWAAVADEVSATGDDEVWRTGAAGDRLAVLAARRATDPAGARALVEETWPGEKAKDRGQILEVLRTGLSPDDEPFLEARLDDRAPTVRAAAADLLAMLPGSQLAQRMTGRVRPLVAHRREKLEITLPDPPDTAARRDGIVDAGAPSGTGRRTWWLIQLVGATPLTFWTGELGLSPADAVQQAQQRELVDGWVLAASRSSPAGGGAGPKWARELLRVAPDPRLLRALPPEQARDLLPVALERATDPAVAGLLVATPAPWPALLSQWVVHRLRANRNAVALDRSLTRLAAAGDAEIIPDLERWIDELRLHDRLRTTLRDVAHTLSIRRTIAQELS